LREEAENRRAAEAKLQQYERELEQLRRNQPKPELPKPPERPDPLLDLPGFYQYFEDREATREKNLRGEFSFEFARSSNPERFDKALAAVQQASPADILRVKDAYNPGKELLAWYAQHERTTIVGDDLEAYNKKVLAEALKNPEHLRQAAEALRLSVVPSTNGSRQPSPVRLPPSLNSMSPSGAAPTGDDDADLSDEALFRHATTGMRR
jgi:G3E family GTPase